MMPAAADDFLFLTGFVWLLKNLLVCTAGWLCTASTTASVEGDQQRPPTLTTSGTPRGQHEEVNPGKEKDKESDDSTEAIKDRKGNNFEFRSVQGEVDFSRSLFRTCARHTPSCAMSNLSSSHRGVQVAPRDLVSASTHAAFSEFSGRDLISARCIVSFP